MQVRAARARREGEILTPSRSYCISLAQVIDQVETTLRPYGQAVLIGFDIRETLIKAVLNNVFYGTVCRGNKYFIALTEMEYLGIPTDVALMIYQTTLADISSLFKSLIGHPINYTEYGYEFLTDTDVLITAVPLHELARMPLNDD